jgi:tripartite ATP-independent transporter DctM subunit
MISIYFLIPMVILVIAFIIKMPISLGMILGTLAYFFAKGQNVGSTVHILINAMMNSYVLLSIPLFIFTANVMNNGAVTEKMYSFINGIFGRFRGGTAYVNVFGSLVFAGMTGSSVADASGLGKMEIEQMKKEGYDAGFSCALSATTAILGPTFPPSIILVIYSTLSGASVGNLFLGGMVPAVLLSLAFSAYITLTAKKYNYPYGIRQKGKEFIRSTIAAIPALLTPVILLGGIYTGIMTPTEAGATGALWALVVSFLIYRNLDLKALWNILKDTAKSTGTVGLIVLAAYGFSHIVAAEHVPEIIGNFIITTTDNKYLFLLIINIVLLILGCFFDSNTIQLVFLPTVIPAVQYLGIDMVHFGVITSLNIIIGQCTPPFGVLLFIVSGLTKTPLKDVINKAIPLVVVAIITLFILVFVPDLIMFLPNHFGR